MTEIPYDQEVTTDWDWFAVDADGHIAHFATGSFRRLPQRLRASEEAVASLVEYFNSAPPTGGCIRFSEIEKHPVFMEAPDKAWFLSSFETMASRGLYSYYGEPREDGGYIGVCMPEVPLVLSSLPPNIQESVGRTRSTITFAGTFHISESATLQW